MAQRFEVHPTHPQKRLIDQAAKILREGGLAVLPTDACYALCCHLGDKTASERLRAIRGIDDKHLLTILCSDLSQLSNYAKVDNGQFRFLKHWTPGPYTFVLEATKEVPRRLAHPSRKSIGLRVPDTPILRALLETLGEPVLASTLKLPNTGRDQTDNPFDDPMSDPDEIIATIGKRIDLLIDVGMMGTEPTTIINMEDGTPLVQRAGLGAEAISAALK
jgi:tRNA threonylcarbamoyl adenosine modification protein (Sua5/YciO/YrdC/YwlC family)